MTVRVRAPRGCAFLIGLLALTLAGCASTVVEPYRGEAPGAVAVFVVASGHHTELALPAEAIQGHLAVFRQDFPGARFLAFGWGERTYFMAARPTLGESIRALFPASSVLLVTGLERPLRQAFGADARVIPVRVSREGLDHMARFIWSYVAGGREGKPRLLGPGPRAASAFYASMGTYDLLFTCNTWTAEALSVAGEPISANGVFLASQVVDLLEAHARLPVRVQTQPASGLDE